MKQLIYFNYSLSNSIETSQEIYILNKDWNGSNLNNVNLVPDDFASGKTFREADHIAALYVNDVYDTMVKSKDIEFLIKYGGKDFAELLIKKKIHAEIRNIIEPYTFCKSVLNKYQINATDVMLYFNLNSYFIFRILSQRGIINNDYNIPQHIKIKAFLKDIAKKVYFMYKLLLFPEMIFFKTKANNSTSRRRYLSGVHLYHGNSFERSNYSIDFFIDNVTLKSNDIIFVIDQPQPKEYILHAKQTEHNVIDYNDIFNMTDTSLYLRKHYFMFVSLRFKYLYMIFKTPVISSTLFSSYWSIAVWSLFYQHYQVNNFFRLMIGGETTSSLVHKKNGVKSIFVYTQPTQSLTKKPFNGNCHDYSYMYFEILLTDNLSKYWLSNQYSKFDSIIENGSMFSDLLLNCPKDKINQIRNKISRDKNIKVVAFYDNTVGNGGVLSYSNYYAFLDGINYVLNEINEDVMIALKIKKNYDIIKNMNDDIKNMFQKLEIHHSFVLLNQYQYNPYDIMAASDLIVSSPMSSVIGTSLAAKKNTLIFDPDSNFSYDCNIFTKFKNIYIKNKYDLLVLIKDNLSDKNYTVNNNKKYIDKYVDSFCNGKAIQRFQKILSVE